MMIQGKVVSVALDVDYPKKSKDGGSYQAFVLKYVNGRNEVKEIVKPMAGLKFKPTVAQTLRELSQGDVFTVQIEKNKAGYDDVVALKKGEASVEMAQSAETEKGNTGWKGKVTGSNYETPEERKIRQRLIVRQSSFTQAREFSPKSKLEDLFDIAQKIEDWVYRDLGQ